MNSGDRFEVRVRYELPLDNDGFVRRQCPNCSRQFKWHSGPANEEAEQFPAPDVYYCPLCGAPALADQWLTDAQVEYVQQVANRAAMERFDEELSGVFRGMSSKHLKIKQTRHLGIPDLPDPLVEPDDMLIVMSPCHAFEPVKLPENEAAPFHCLVCGAAFAI